VSSVINWHEAKPAPLVFVTGTESYLAGRAIRQIKQILKHEFPELEISEIADGEYRAGSIFELAAPSLFGEARLIIVQGPAEGSRRISSDTSNNPLTR